MDENEDNSINKSRVETEEHQCGDIFVDFNYDVDHFKLVQVERHGLINVNTMQNDVVERVTSLDNELSEFVEDQLGCGIANNVSGIERNDVFEIEVGGKGGKGVEGGVLKSISVYEMEAKGNDECEYDKEEDRLECKFVCAGESVIKGELEVKNVFKVVNGDMDEGDKLVGEVVSERAMDDVLGADCETRLLDKDASEVDDEVKGKWETIGAKLMAESDEVDDAGEEENVEMEYVGSKSLNDDEVIDGKRKDKLERTSGFVSVADDSALEDKSLVMGYESKEKDDEMELVPGLSDEEDEMKIAREDDGDECEGVVSQPDNVSQLSEDEEEKRMLGDVVFSAADIKLETGIEAGDSTKIGGGKRMRGKNTKAAAKAQLRNALPVEEEDVCFVCFDGGDLVLCDRKNCPKAYHPSCVNRDEKFFQTKGRWNCGWHQCSHKNCQKNAYYMCYTCTFSLCKGCSKASVILCVRGNKGFCEGCMKIVMMIEDTAQGNQAQIDFDDKSSWEYLFKDYWIDLKDKLSISPVEIAQAKSPWKVSDVGVGKNEYPCELLDMKDGGFYTDNASDNPELSKPKKKKYKKRLNSRAKQDELTGEAVSVGSEGRSTPKSTKWASKELLEFVMHMRDGDITVLSQFDVQALLLEYIKRNRLRDPHRKSQIICDFRLEKAKHEECKRLRQSIKCGLIDLLTVGDILNKAMEVQWLESEMQRLTHLCDRASDLGKKKQLRECVEGLELLRTPEERKRRLEDIPEIHADPKRDPNFESEDNNSEIDSNKQEMSTRLGGSGFSSRGREPISPGSGVVKDSWCGKNNFNNSWHCGRGSQTERHKFLENPTSPTSSEAFGLDSNSAAKSDSFSHVQPQNSPASLTFPVATSAMNISETNKMWHYEDPQKKVQGPFSLVQLRKWSNTGYFPADLKIWSSSGNKDDSFLLTDALAGKFKELSFIDNGISKSNALHSPNLISTHSGRHYEFSLHQGRRVQDADILNSDQNNVTMVSNINPASRNWAAASVEVPILSEDKTNPNYSGRNNWVNLPSSTTKQSSVREVSIPIADASLPGSIEVLHSPAAATPESSRTLKLVSEHSFTSPFDALRNPEQGNLSVSTNSLQSSQSTAAAPETNSNVVQSVSGQNPASGTQGWGSSPAQSLEEYSSNQASTQQPASSVGWCLINSCSESSYKFSNARCLIATKSLEASS